MFRINLHIDDEDVLYEIQKHLGVVYVETQKHSCTFVIRKTEDIITRLVPLLEINTLRTTKYFDFMDFRTANLRLAGLYEKSHYVHLDISLISKIIGRMNSKRHPVDISKNSSSANLRLQRYKYF